MPLGNDGVLSSTRTRVATPPRSNSICRASTDSCIGTACRHDKVSRGGNTAESRPRVSPEVERCVQAAQCRSNVPRENVSSGAQAAPGRYIEHARAVARSTVPNTYEPAAACAKRIDEAAVRWARGSKVSRYQQSNGRTCQSRIRLDRACRHQRSRMAHEVALGNRVRQVVGPAASYVVLRTGNISTSEWQAVHARFLRGGMGYARGSERFTAWDGQVSGGVE